jgi:hypothetical protein
MHLSARSKLGLSITVVLGLLLVLLGGLVSLRPFAKAAPASAGATYTGTFTTGARLASSSAVFAAQPARAATQKPDRVIPSHHAHSNGASTRAASAPQVADATLAQVPEGKVAHNFNGVSSADSFANNGFQDTPPDQGLCVGFLGDQKVVIEIVNSSATIYTTSGVALMGPVSLGTAFQDVNAFSDPRCFYDTATQSFYLTVISFDNNTGNSVNDVEVINGLGATTYQFDSSIGGACFGDQPHTGYDTHALYITTDEFCGPGQNTEEGALVMALSKAQLVAQAATINAVEFGSPTPLTIGGLPITTLEPSFGAETGTEYLLNSFPFDQSGNNIASSNSLGFWTVKGDEAITSGHGTVTLTGKLITSETYVFPVPAASTGDDSIFCVVGNHPLPPCPNGLEPILREAFLQPDDSRMLQVQLVNDDQHGLQLYAALDSAVTLHNDPVARDGAAWFVLDPKQGTITSQGFVAVKGAYLLYPAILHTHAGTTAISFTITSPKINPSTGYVVDRSNGRDAFGGVHITGEGTGQHNSFAGPVFNDPRWGDYSAEELDPNGVDIWSASEYIPPLADQAQRDNWGTEVWDIAGDQ